MRTRATRSSSYHWSPATFQGTAGLPELPELPDTCLVRLVCHLPQPIRRHIVEKRNIGKEEEARAAIVIIAGCLLLYAYLFAVVCTVLHIPQPSRPNRCPWQSHLTYLMLPAYNLEQHSVDAERRLQ